MSAQNESPAVAIARAHVEAWGRHEFDTARSMLAPDVRVRVTTTAPYPPDTDLTGAETYTEGLHAYAEPVVPGSVRVLASTGDDRNALLLLSLAQTKEYEASSRVVVSQTDPINNIIQTAQPYRFAPPSPAREMLHFGCVHDPPCNARLWTEAGDNCC